MTSATTTTRPDRARTRRWLSPTAAVLAAGALIAAASAPTIALAAADPDTTPPVTTLHVPTTPPSGWYTTTSVPVRMIAADASGIASLSYALGDAAPVTSTSNDVSIVITAEGENRLTVWATDAAGNVETAVTRVFRIDRTAPEIDVTSPVLVERGASVTFDYACRDAASGIASCTAALAAGAPLPTDELGEHEYEIVATDIAGSTTTRTFRYTVAPDLTAPEVSLAIAPEPASGWYTMPLGIGVVARDASDIASWHWWTDGAVAMNGDVTGEEWEAVFTLDFDGVTDISYWAYDAYGNRGEGSHRVRLDTVAPSVALAGSTLAAPVYRQGQSVTIDASCSDATSGVAECGVLESPSGAVPTDVLGDHSLTLFGVDVAGNRTETAFAYRVVAAPVSEGPDGGSDGDSDGVGAPNPSAHGGEHPPALARTGADLTGLVLLAGLLAGVGVSALGIRRMLRR